MSNFYVKCKRFKQIKLYLNWYVILIGKVKSQKVKCLSNSGFWIRVIRLKYNLDLERKFGFFFFNKYDDKNLNFQFQENE